MVVIEVSILVLMCFSVSTQLTDASLKTASVITSSLASLQLLDIPTSLRYSLTIVVDNSSP